VLLGEAGLVAKAPGSQGPVSPVQRPLVSLPCVRDGVTTRAQGCSVLPSVSLGLFLPICPA
jgi:hypothetical protein